ncbi:type II toxin-antitoxin system RelE/ParE family toxin [Mucilaginibacter terrigena]|uniref:Type II toxin-antitoxin system RelE/ParE family toxin n=1 Tax=Mucilaginibacter terrigena TaxID=2492395 RepID=A0A4Q5LH95_9SPHI|nr:type II toxin-antitoxin system RelE/ParE family toxin [Mucilaginibacter terrigena]RYU86223.1 type II toxin-antitoxin system RelE/ParE family toxin [Mucilaginibacter terrigena]
MDYIIEFADKAQFELFDGWSWYEMQQTGLGNRFEDEVYKKIEQVRKNPLFYMVVGKHRQANTEVFPYVIVFRIEKKRNVIWIASIFHTSRHPKRKNR